MIAVIAVIGVITMTRVADETIALHDDDVIPMTYLEEVHASEIKSRLDLHRVAVAGTDAERQQRLTGLQETDAQLAAATASYKRTSPLAESAAMKQYESNWAKYIQIRDQQLLPLAMRGDTAGFSKLHAEVAQPVLSEAADGIDSLVDQHGQGSTAAADAADRDYTSGLAWIIGISLVSLLAFVVASQLITRTIVRPLQRMRQALSALAAGDLTSTTGITSTDELGQMATDLDIAITSTRETIKSVGVDAERTAWVATQTASLNQDIAQHADETSQRSESVNQTAQAVSENVHTVASATEEMRSSIAEIGNSSTQASTVAGEAVIVARTTNDTINRLSSSSAEIDSVVRVITSIAEQTNLLALNATIEAARAGAAGKGFAVVASEVKDLAQETARATTGIVSQIGAIQTDTASAVDAIGQIVRIIDQIAQYQETIAAAVEEQTASAGEIGRSLLDASEGSATIASNMHEVNQSAQATTGSIGEAIKASSDLTTVSRELQDLIGRFRY